MRGVRAHLAEIALIVSCAVLLLSAFLFKLNYDQGNDIKDVVNQIQQSRIVLSKQSCRQRNNERAITRGNLRQSKAQLARIPDAALHQLGFTRVEALANVNRQLRQVRPLDCKRLVRQVAGNKVGRVGGGGSGASAAPRPTVHQAASKHPKSPGGSSGAVGPQSPSEPPRQGGKPPPNGGGSPSSPNPPSGGSDGGVVTPPETPTVPHQDPGSLVQQVVDRVQSVVQQILPPLP